ncbi:M48 family metallopeptidase [Pelistega sp. NLN82]|uniref:M48 family metallopeptidase n=1 Tax=Pelistega ratti TaxID=2652177 RepID=A0A6L9Y6U8_9BURK|nr:M48 family metallopeptidase [Pelistega ratti]NEN75498.1 M48 family metallopeptidase [Pelistega ratti]
MTTFTLVFIVFLIAQTTTQLYLSTRQIRSVSQHKEAVPAEFAQKINLQSHQRAAQYTIATQRLHMVSVLINVIVLLGFTLFGGLTALNTWLASHISSPVAYQVLLVLAVTFISALIDIPLSIYKTFVIEQSFGFNRMSVGLFIKDLIKSTLISTLFMASLLYLLFTFLKHFFTPYWWIWAWAGLSIMMVLLMAIVPKFIMPLFNKFTPLDDPVLKERIQGLAQRANFGLKELYVMDGSKRSSHGNAYFTGFGKNRRIVFFDTLLNKLTPAEVEAVLAHELGHFKHKHVLKRILLTFVMSFIFFALLGYLINQPWFFAGLGVFHHVTQPIFGLAIVLFLLVLPVFMFFYTPIGNLLSRKDEFEADQYAVQQTNAEDLTSALVKLYDDNAATLTPDALHSAFYDSHPPASIRIAHLKKAA